MSRNNLSASEELRKGDYLISNTGNFKAVFQEDGNFVIYGWKPIWASDTVSTEPLRLCMQQDCNLVMYKKDGHAMWHTNTVRSEGNMCRLHLRNDGVLCVEKGGEDIWCSSNSKGIKN